MTHQKRKSSSIAQETTPGTTDLPLGGLPPAAKRRNRGKVTTITTNPTKNHEILDGPNALRASPDAEDKSESFNANKAGLRKGQIKEEADDVPSLVADGSSVSSLSELSDAEPPLPKLTAKKEEAGKNKKAVKEAAPSAPRKKAKNEIADPEADGEEEVDEEEVKEALSRSPPVNSDYLPLPWKGRLGYACLNTYLRFSNPPVFSSRTCRIASILDNRHPLQNPNESPHPTKNRPDKDKPADEALGRAYVENIGLANARDIIKMVRWNDRYGIKFMRLSSEMFPFASHDEYGYRLAPFASETLAEAGRVIAELNHRVTTHPGQFTQLGSPRKQVIDNAIRDLDYHSEMLSLLKLPPQQDRDAVMILHIGGVFGDKGETLTRFRENYKKLSPEVRKRLVLENDDVSWSIHDVLPLCEELNIPCVLDFHHHNIIFDSDQIREGTKDIVDLFPRILKTWRRKNITPKMHYSEPTPQAITGRQRRKHSPRVATLPPCPPNMDLMIEAKDKEQAVFELMRTFKLPGFHLFNDIIPHVRKDDNKVVKLPKKKKKGDEEVEEEAVVTIPDDEVGMGGPEGRVYWPPGMEEWLRPVKRVVKKKDPGEKATPAKGSKAKIAKEENVEAEEPSVADAEAAAQIVAKKGKASNAQKKTTTAGKPDKVTKSSTKGKGAEADVPIKNSKEPVRSSRRKRVNYVEEDEDD
ncbi:MAG: hypothetical protein LQ340_001904 [Diploschistes diacapsis]|nr:MAG: hypothetical protein LQ340_001904 [Diploschistes diacapsis]